MKQLPFGKLQTSILRRRVLAKLGAESESVLVGPAIGVDCASVRATGKFLVISSDPVTGVLEKVGWYAVNVSANDVATSGVKPAFLESIILLPEGATEESVDNLASDIDSAARRLGMAVVGGHTEVTPHLDRAIVIATTFGFGDSYVSSANAREGDVIIMSKTAGLEGTSILSSSFRGKLRRLRKATLREGAAMIKKISVVDDAMTAFRTGYVHAMHDATEGGVLGALYEMAVASGLGFEAREESIPLDQVTREICDVLHIDPLRLISSGALLVSVDPDGVDAVSSALRRRGIPATPIGVFRRGDNELVGKDGKRQKVDRDVVDELWRIFRRPGWKQRALI